MQIAPIDGYLSLINVWVNWSSCLHKMLLIIELTTQSSSDFIHSVANGEINFFSNHNNAHYCSFHKSSRYAVYVIHHKVSAYAQYLCNDDVVSNIATPDSGTDHTHPLWTTATNWRRQRALTSFLGQRFNCSPIALLPTTMRHVCSQRCWPCVPDSVYGSFYANSIKIWLSFMILFYFFL